jgi:hypothetical protein
MRGLTVGACGLAMILATGSFVRTQTPAEAELLKLDQERCKAITESNWTRYSELMADDLVHIHATGRIENKTQVLEGMRASPRATYRGGEITVRVYGDTAVMVGSQFNKVGTQQPTESAVTQVWVRRAGKWQQVSFQATRKAPPAG